MVDDFDAYRKWLGIPPKEQPPHHYRLLGIAPFEDDADVIQNAADRQMAHIRTFQTGKHGAQSQKLLNELAGARGCLMDRHRKSEYDSQLRLRLAGENGAAREEKTEPFAAVATVVGPPPPPLPAPPRMRPPVTPPPTAAAAASAVAVAPAYGSGEMMEGEPHLAPRTSSVRRGAARGRAPKNANLPLVIGGAVVGVLVLLGVIVVAMSSKSTVNDEPSKTVETPKKPDIKTPTPVATVPSKPTRVEPPRPRPEPRPEPRFDPPPRRPSETVNTNLPTSPKFVAPTSSPPPDVLPENATPAEKVAFELRRARGAMGRRDMEEAKRRVIDAEYAAKDDATKQQVAHVKALCAFLEEFWAAARQGVFKMKADEKVHSVLGYDVEFLKVEGEMVTYRSAGNHHNDKISDVRSSAATVFAQKVLGDSNHAQQCVVAFLLLDRPTNGFRGANLHQERLSKAKQLYDELKKKGAGDPVLDKEISNPTDAPPLDLTAGPSSEGSSLPELVPFNSNMPSEEEAAVDKRTPVPDDKSLSEARKRLLTKFSSNMERARSVEQKLDFAKQLRTEAESAAAEPAWQYVLVEKARDLGIETGKPELVLEAVDVLGKTFAIDTLKDKAVALNKCFLANNSQEQAATVNTLAYSLFREAQMARRFEVAESAGDLAARTARKARDQAAERMVNEQLPAVKKQALEATRMEQALTRLKADPADAGANTFAGRHYCFIEENWQRGLPLLGKGNEGDLHDVAISDLGNPTAASDQAVLGDRWFKLGRATSDDTRAPQLRRAKHWYELALPQLSGGERTVAEERLKEIESLIPLAKSF